MKRTLKTSGDEYVTDCPKCGKKDHFYINKHTGKGYCHRCHLSSGDLSFTLKLLGDKSLRSQFDLRTQKEIVQSVVLPECYPIWEQCEGKENELIRRKVLTYLKKEREISDYSDWVYWDIRFTPQYEVLIPIYQEGRLVYWTARSIWRNSKQRYRNPSAKRGNVLFNIDTALLRPTALSWNLFMEEVLWKDHKSYESGIWIMEGVFDVMSSHNPKAIALLSNSITDYQRNLLLANSKKFFVFLDRQAVKEALEIADELYRCHSEVWVYIPTVDKDPGDLFTVRHDKWQDYTLSLKYKLGMKNIKEVV